MRRLDAQIDRISLVHLCPEDLKGEDQSLEDQHVGLAAETLSSPRVNELLRIVKSLSSSNSGALLHSPEEFSPLLTQSGLTRREEAPGSQVKRLV